MALTNGLDMARQNRFFTNAEGTFMVVNPLGVTYFRSDMGSDGNGLSNPQNWVEHVADGSNLAEETALVGEEGLVSRNFMPRYRLLERVFRGVCGLPFSDVNIDGNTRRKLVFKDVEGGSPAIETETGYYGMPELASRLRGGKIRSFNIDVRRAADGGSVSGSIEYHFNRLEPGIVVPGAIASNAKYRFSAKSAIGAGTFAVGVVSNTPVGERHTVDGTGDTFTIYGDIVVDTSTASLGSVQTAIRAKTGRASAVVGGTITAALEVNKLPQGATRNFDSTSDSVTNVVFSWRVMADNTGIGQILATDSSPAGWNVEYANGKIIVTAPIDFPLSQGMVVQYKPIPATNSLFYNVENLQVVAAGTAINAAASLAIQYDPAAGNVGDIVVSGVGYSGTTTPLSSTGALVVENVTFAKTDTAPQIKTKVEAHSMITLASVVGVPTDKNFSVEIINPGNTRVSITKVSGVNWAVSQRALGGDGTELKYLEGPYLEPDHWRVYIATNDADLATIDTTDLPDDEGNGGDPHLLSTCTAVTFSMADLWKLHYSGNAKRYATDFTAGARTVAASLVIPNDETEGSDCNFILSTQDGCVATGFWLKIVYGCGGFELVIDVFVGRNQAVGYEVDNDVWLRSFPLVRKRNPDGTGSLRFTLITPIL